MTISIVAPCYNCSKYIAEAIKSVQAQTFQDWELLIVDDCSSDNSVEIVKNAAEGDKRIKLYSTQKNGGAGVARNIAIKEARGRYLAFIDIDDWWYPNKLECQLEFMQKNGYEFTFTDYQDCDDQLNVLHEHVQGGDLTLADIYVECSVGTPGVMIDTQRIGKLYMPESRRSEDWGFWIKVIELTKKAYVIHEPLWKYRHNKGSATSSKFGALKDVFMMYRKTLGFSLLKAWYYFVFKMIPRYISKKITQRY